MESWRTVWREGLGPILSDAALAALAGGLEADDPALKQGATTTPLPLMCVQDWDCEGGCLIGYAGWKGDGLRTVGEVEEYFAARCFEADQRMGEPAAVRWLLNWYDDAPRDEMRTELLAEVRREQERRAEKAAPTRDPFAGLPDGADDEPVPAELGEAGA